MRIVSLLPSATEIVAGLGLPCAYAPFVLGAHPRARPFTNREASRPGTQIANRGFLMPSK